MAKWQFSRVGSWDYPTLGFSASYGDVIEADLAPDAYWDAVDASTPVTIPVTPSAGAVEDPDGGMLVYDAATNRYVAKTPAQARAALSVLSETEQDARYRARDMGFGRTIAFLGDSIATYNQASPDAFPYHLCALSGGRLTMRGIYGTGGYTLAQIESVHLPTVLALDPAPAMCVIAGITNDIGTSVPTATSKATLTSIIDSLAAAGIEPVLWKAPPRSDSSTANDATRAWNAYIGFLAASRGFKVVDGWTPVVDEATGVYRSGYNADTVHPNLKGHQAIGEYAAASADFQGLSQAVPYLTADDHANGPELILPSGRSVFLDGLNGNGWPTGFSGYGTSNHTLTIEADATIPGNWLQLARLAGAGAASGGYQYDLTSGVTAGDLIYIAARFDMTCDASAAGMRPQLFMQPRLSGVSLGTYHVMGPGGDYTGIASRLARMPATTNQLRIEVSVGGAAPTIDSVSKIAQLTVLNLTALGIDTAA